MRVRWTKLDPSAVLPEEFSSTKTTMGTTAFGHDDTYGARLQAWLDGHPEVVLARGEGELGEEPGV